MEFRHGKELSFLYSLTDWLRGPTILLVNGRRCSFWGMKLATNLHLVLRLEMSGSILPVLLCLRDMDKDIFTFYRIYNHVSVLRKRVEQRLEAAQMKFLRHLLGITKLDKEKNQCIREKNGSTEHSNGNKIIPGKVATTRTEDGHK